MDQSFYKDLLDNVDFSIAVHEMVYDPSGNPQDYRYLYVNKPFCDLMSRTQDKLIGQLAYEVFPHIEKTWLHRYHEVLVSGDPQSFTNYTKEVDRYFNVYAFKSGPNQFVTSFRDVTTYMTSLAPDQRLDVMTNLIKSDQIAYFEFDLKQKTFDYSPVLRDIIGMENITYEDYMTLFETYMHPLDQERYHKHVRLLFTGEENQLAMQVRFMHQRTNEYKWLSFFVFVDELYRKVPIKIRGIVKDIDSERKLEAKRLEMEKLFAETRRIANIATFYFDLKTNEFRWSKELDEFTGIDNLIDLEQIRSIVHPDDLDTYDYSTNEIANNKDGMVTNFRILKQGEVHYIQSSIFPDMDESGSIQFVSGILKDITELEKSRQEIEYFANHDVLTGLYNRLNFERYSAILETYDNLALMICDVDGLKLINDAFGHIEGDTLLKHLSDILRNTVGEENVYRIGGDEFVLTVPNSTDDELAKIQRTIKDNVRQFRIYGVGFDISIGMAKLDEVNSFEEAFRKAENIMYRRKLTERKSRKSTALNTIMQTMHERTEETEDHCMRVSNLAVSLLQATGHKRDYEVYDIRLVADFHDIGKISISDRILNKPGKLTPEEYEQIKYHSESGYKVISNIIDNEDIAMAILYHHERFDGTGYPHGLIGEDIPLYARIISICDAYDAMTSDRVYRKALTKKQAIKEINNHAGTQFDPALVEHFNQIIKKW